mmetsp:Transcript_12755/g.39645  ORF Transcript_12755/g.39645 Transcript_12755/m.39645 type:complete len:215 (+) Transcript_12755:626-1270(+)
MWRRSASPPSPDAARDSRIWWMVGTAVNHVTFAPPSTRSRQKVEAEKRPSPAGRSTSARASRGASRPASRPCTWKSGITRYVASDSLRVYVSTMLVIDATRFACASGTCLGRPVVPLVCSTSAVACGRGAGSSSISLAAASSSASRDRSTRTTLALPCASPPSLVSSPMPVTPALRHATGTPARPQGPASASSTLSPAPAPEPTSTTAGRKSAR